MDAEMLRDRESSRQEIHLLKSQIDDHRQQLAKQQGNSCEKV